MCAPTASQLLDAWERGLMQTPIQRALSLLALSTPQASAHALELLSIGQRDLRLFALRDAVFGPQLNSTTGCEGCGEELEMELNVHELCSAANAALPAKFTANIEGHRVEFRLPNSRDLLAASAAPDEPTARAGLLRACVLSVHRGKASVTLARVPSNVVELLTAKMAEADPMAVMEMQLACPRCQRQWTALFDIASFLWTELSAWARRMLREVHALASVYGWSESEIVGMSPARRSIYLELIAA